MKQLRKRITAVMLSLAMVLAFMPVLGGVSYASDQVKSVSIDVIAQAGENSISGVFRNYEVKPGYAKELGYPQKQGYEDKVVTIDVLAAVHHEMYGEAFDTAPTDYLVMTESGTITKIFGVSTQLLGYFIDYKFPVYPDNPTMGSVANDTVIESGNIVNVWRYYSEFFTEPLLYFDSLDYYALTGQSITATLNYTQPYKMASATEEPREDTVVALLDKDGETVATDTSDKDGEVTFTVNEPGEYALTVKEIEKDEIFEDAHFVVPYAEVHVAELAKPSEAKVTVAARSFNTPNAFDVVPQEVNVSSDAAESYGDYGDIFYGNNNGIVTTADVLYTIHRNKYGAAFTSETADQYLGITPTGWNTKLFGVDANASASAVNEDLNMVGGSYSTTFEDGDQLDMWAYVDKTGWSDTLTCFNKKAYTARANEEFEVQVEGIGWGGNVPVSTASEGSFVAATYNDSGQLTPIEGAVMDEDGRIKLSFTEEGTYNISASGKIATTGWDGSPIDAIGVLPWATVTVISNEGADEIQEAIKNAEDLVKAAEKANEEAEAAAAAAAASKKAADEAMKTPGQAAVDAAKKAQADAEIAEAKADEAVKAADKACAAAEQAYDAAVSEAEKNAALDALDAADNAAEKAEANKEAADKALVEAKAAVKAAEEGKTAAVTSIVINQAKVTANTLDAAVKKAGGSEQYITTITLGKKVKKISKGAFAKYGKATTLEVKSRKLKKKAVKGSLKGSAVTTVKVKVGSKKVNKKYVKKYKKIFTKKNAGKKAKVTR